MKLLDVATADVGVRAGTFNVQRSTSNVQGWRYEFWALAPVGGGVNVQRPMSNVHLLLNHRERWELDVER